MVDKIDKALGVIVDVIPKNKISDVSRYLGELVYNDEDIEDIDDDYKYQRENFYRLVEQGSAAIDGILELARESEHPRAYEVAGQLIKTVTDTNRD